MGRALQFWWSSGTRTLPGFLARAEVLMGIRLTRVRHGSGTGDSVEPFGKHSTLASAERAVVAAAQRFSQCYGEC
jgi:hypothetical protein